MFESNTQTVTTIGITKAVQEDVDASGSVTKLKSTDIQTYDIDGGSGADTILIPARTDDLRMVLDPGNIPTQITDAGIRVFDVPTLKTNYSSLTIQALRIN